MIRQRSFRRRPNPATQKLRDLVAQAWDVTNLADYESWYRRVDAYVQSAFGEEGA
jgi:hypothetical protein